MGKPRTREEFLLVWNEEFGHISTLAYLLPSKEGLEFLDRVRKLREEYLPKAMALQYPEGEKKET
jgi:hypothetical protein